jgi:hypothetical protein
MGIFIEFAMDKLQKHIGGIVGNKIKPGDARKIMMDEKKMKNKALNIIRLSIGEEIITENYAKINSKVIKSENNVIISRNLLKQYQILYHTFYKSNEVEEKIDKNIVKGKDSLRRIRAIFSVKYKRSIGKIGK